jgi:glycosyltransferase involved in cell wall biosynthesis
MGRMRIAFVATGGFDRSGRERVIPSLLWLIERLARQHEVVVYVLRYLDTPARYQLAGATISDLGSPEGPARQAATLLRAMREDGPFDIVHGYWAVPAGWLVALLGLRLGIPSIVTLDSGEFASLPSIGYGLQSSPRTRLLVRTATALASHLTVCSEYQAGLAQARGLAPQVIPLGVDPGLFSRRQTPPSSGGPFRLLHVASLNPVKDQVTLLQALRALGDGTLDATLDIVGEDTMAGRLQWVARELGVLGRVTFHGFLPSEALAPLYHAADLFVLTSLHEAAAVVLLEAAACEVPVIGSAVGYIADWAPDRATAVPPGRPGELADAIDRLLRDSSRRRDTAAAAAQWACAHDANWTAQQFDALYREAVGSYRYKTRRFQRLPFVSRRRP